MTDNEIINLILQGDQEKFSQLVEKYQPMVFRTCMGFLHNKDNADDLTQDIFISLYQSLPRFKYRSAFSTWLYRISINASLNKVRQSTGNPFMQSLNRILDSGENIHSEFNISDMDNPESIMIKNEHRAWVQKALDSLSENQRTAIILSKYEDLSQKEIAEIMDTTEGAVEALLQRAKANLRKKLSSSQK